MKYLILLLFLLLVSSFSSYAALMPRDLKCSRAGSDILLVNGINWGEPSVVFILAEIEQGFFNNKGILDSKGTNGSHVTFKYSYNNSNGFLRDMLESAAQKLSQNFNISASNAFIAAYYFTYKGVVTADFIESIYNARGVTFSSISTYLISYFSPNTLDKMVQDSFNTNATDTIKLKSSISDTLLSGKKLILITESQGNFFGKQAISNFLGGENLNFGGKTGRINDYLGTIGQVQIAPPTGSLLSKNRVVLNDKDIINLVFFDKPSSNFVLIPPSPDLRKVEIDRYANHFITSTYLNSDDMTTGNLSALKDFTLQSIVNLASSLESNCPKAVINYTKNNLVVNFDSTDPEDPNVTGLTYSWNFGDGQTANTTSKALFHTYALAGVYTVSLTVTDAYGASDITTKLIDVNGGNTILVNFCNAGLLPGTMNVNLQGYNPFSIDHEFPASGDNYDPHTCGCHSIELPIGQTIPITVSGSGSYQGETYTFAPFQALIYISSSTQYFSTRSVNFVNGEVIVTLSSGIAFANRCSDVYTYP